jgi:deoxyribonuclease V
MKSNETKRRLKELIRFQNTKAPDVTLQDSRETYQRIGFVTIVDHGDTIQGGSLVFRLQSQSVLNSWVGSLKYPENPYIAGGLSLRYKKVFLEAINQFSNEIDIIIIYPSAGVQHPRFFGLTSEIGLELSIPSIGLTRNALVGNIDPKSSWYITENVVASKVKYQNRVVAFFLRVRGNKRGLYVSPGHKVSVETAVDLIAVLLKHRLPEPLRILRKFIQTGETNNF